MEKLRYAEMKPRQTYSRVLLPGLELVSVAQEGEW